MGTVTWLEEELAEFRLTDEGEGYLLGRGAKEQTIKELECLVWQPLATPSPDPVFQKRYGVRGESLTGCLVFPQRSPKGTLLGVEVRSMYEKWVGKYQLPAAAWNPIWIGMQRAMPRVWAGGDVWVVEGAFDLFPLEWGVPETDAILASGRARLSWSHVEYLRRYCKGWVYMVYDNDEAGQQGMHGWTDKAGKWRQGALKSLERVKLRCMPIVYRGGKDPGEIWDAHGAEGIRKAFSRRI